MIRINSNKASLFITLFFCIGCSSDENKQNDALLLRVDSMEKNIQYIKQTYKPDLGEIMNTIQIHHAKLWYAGINENWKLSAFEMEELEETFKRAEDLYPMHDEQPLAKLIPAMIVPQLDSVSKAIEEKNKEKFIAKYNMLTTSCNNCHVATQHEFNVIKTPDSSPATNQEFKMTK